MTQKRALRVPDSVGGPDKDFQHHLNLYVVDLVRLKTKVVISEDYAALLVRAIVEQYLRRAIGAGRVRLPWGLGTLEVRQFRRRRRALPTGEVRDVAPTRGMRYVEGKQVQVLMGKRDQYGATKGRKWAIESVAEEIVRLAGTDQLLRVTPYKPKRSTRPPESVTSVFPDASV